MDNRILLKNFIINQKWAIGFSEIRFMVSSKAILVNDVEVDSIDHELFTGDVVKYGKHKTAIVE